jgi:hypothetical protein
MLEYENELCKFARVAPTPIQRMQVTYLKVALILDSVDVIIDGRIYGCH